MGGPGSGRRGGRPARPLAEDLPFLDVRVLARRWGGFEEPWAAVIELDHAAGAVELHGGSGMLRVRGADLARGIERVLIDGTPCGWGRGPGRGSRPWFLCPGCGRRCAVLFLRRGRLACRRCFGLAYRSQRLGRGDRLAWKCSKLMRRLGAATAPSTREIAKPTRMRWRTFERLLLEAEALEAAAHCELECRFTRQDRQKRRRDFP